MARTIPPVPASETPDSERHVAPRSPGCARFEAGTGERLEALIAGVDEPAFLADVADWIVVCATGADLLDGVRRRRAAN